MHQLDFSGQYSTSYEVWGANSHFYEFRFFFYVKLRHIKEKIKCFAAPLMGVVLIQTANVESTKLLQLMHEEYIPHLNWILNQRQIHQSTHC